ncbi:MAG: CpsD/CapB family tyrosine-protein kinase [Candidatus Rokubacteria bacterium]|nr:CpsD/CapB family tyrosine-protein kinase [Candidatus Rokubacteria bacterium]
MSEFFRALERAEQERILREQARQREAGAVAVEPPGDVAPEETPPAAAPPTVQEPVSTGVERPVEVEVSQPEARSEDGAVPAGVDGHMVSLITPRAFAAEQYRRLRYVVEQLHANANLSVVAVTSPSVGDGKSVTAINLAGALAQAVDGKVLLVEADLRRPSVAHKLALGESAGPGLVRAILDPNLTLESVVCRHPVFNLSILHAGRSEAAPYELLKSPRLGELIADARRRYEYLVLDMPPLLAVPDCQELAQWVDGFLIVVAANRTPRKLVEESLNLIEPNKVVGFVFNRDDRPLSGYYAYYYGYGPAEGDLLGWWGRAAKKLEGSIRGRRFLRGARPARAPRR